MFKTLQDRLVKVTLKDISSIEEANLYLVEYVKKHNDKFAVGALDAEDASIPSLRKFI